MQNEAKGKKQKEEARQRGKVEKWQRDRVAEGQRDRGTEGQRDRGANGQRDRGIERQRGKGAKKLWRMSSSLCASVPLCLCAFVPLCLCAFFLVLASPLPAQEPAETDEALPFTENYSGAMLLNSYGTQLRVTHSTGDAVGRDDSISSLEMFHSIPTGSDVWFYDLRMLVNNNGDVGGNVGIGARRLVDEWDRIFGASFWYDGDDTHRNVFHQLGVSLETYGEDWDARLNVYIPIGDDEKTFAYSSPIGRFEGNNLLFDRTRFDEAAMTGLDAEIGVPLGGSLGEAYNIRAYAGLYHFAADNGPDRLGVSGRLEGRVRPDLGLRLSITNDDEFDTNVSFDVVWYLPGGRRTNDIAPTRTVPDRLEERVYRNYTVVVTETATPETVLATDPLTGLPISVVHVGSDASPGGDGTAGNPFQLLSEAQAGSGAGALIFAHADSVFDAEQITLQNRQQFLGEGIDQAVTTREFGSILLPRATAGTNLPQITGAPSFAVALADDARVAGFEISDASGAAIYANGVAGSVRVGQNTINSSTGPGVNLVGSTASFTFEGTLINGDGSGDGFAIAGGAPTVSFDGDISNQNGGRAISVTNTTGGSVDFTGTVVDRSSLGILVDGAAGDVSIAGSDIRNSNGTGIDVRNSSGALTFDGVRIRNSAGDGITLTNNTGILTFTDLDLRNNSSRGIFASNSGTVNFTGSNSVDSTGGSGIDITLTTVDATFDSLSVASSPGAALSLNNVDGTFTVTGATTIGSAGGAGVSVQNSGAEVLLGHLAVDGASDGILLSSNTGGFTLGADGTASGDGGTISNVTSNGVSMTDAANVSLGFLDVDATSGNSGIKIGTTGADDSTIKLTGVRILGAANEGVELNADGTGTLKATITDSSSTAVNDALNAATSAAGGSLELALSGTTLSSSDRAGANIDGSFGGTLWITDFSNNTVLGNTTGSGGMLVDTAVFDADTQTPGIQQVAGGDTTIGTVVNRVTGDGLRLEKVTGDLAFGDLNIANDGGTGLFVRNLGPATFDLRNTGGVVDTTDGTAIDIDPVTLNSTFSSIASTNSAGYGVLLDSVDGSFTVTGATTITGAASAGIRIANVTDAGATFHFGAVDITDGNDYGIEIDDVAGTLTFADTTIGAPQGGVNSGIQMVGSSAAVTFDNLDITDGGVELLNSTGSFTAGGGSIDNSIGRAIDITLGSVDATFTDMTISNSAGAPAVNVNMVSGGNLLLENNSITATGAEGVSVNHSGTGTFSITASGNTITSTGDSFNAVVSNAFGSLGLNLNNNDASGAYNLNNTAGTFQLGGTLGQGQTFTNDDNGNVANNGNTTNSGAPTVVPTGDIEIVDPSSIPTP